MENRRLVRTDLISALIGAIGGLALFFVLPIQAAEQPDPSVRFYKLNKKGQQVNHMFVRNIHEPGCHNFLRKTPVQRFAQTGFAWCQLFSKKECDPESLVMAMWDGRKYKQIDLEETQPQPKLYKGSRWLLSPEENVDIRSWYCESIKD